MKDRVAMTSKGSSQFCPKLKQPDSDGDKARELFGKMIWILSASCCVVGAAFPYVGFLIVELRLSLLYEIDSYIFYFVFSIGRTFRDILLLFRMVLQRC